MMKMDEKAQFDKCRLTKNLYDWFSTIFYKRPCISWLLAPVVVKKFSERNVNWFLYNFAFSDNPRAELFGNLKN